MTAKDHKRKARPIGPATVTVQDGCITVVVPDVLGKNESHVQGHGGRRVVSKQTDLYRWSVHDAVFAWAQSATRSDSLLRLATQGAWRLEAIGVWPRERHDIGFVAPMGDADAAIPQALDALQHAGILDDDARVVQVTAWNLYRKGVRATVMRLVRVDIPPFKDPPESALPDRDAAIAHLLPLVPPAVEMPAKPARSRRKVKS
jgi:Holliday junction resolvase RusA-like endonuclease